MKKIKWLFILLLSGLLVAGCDEPLQNEPEQPDPTEQTDPDNPKKPDPKPEPKPDPKPKEEFKFIAAFKADKYQILGEINVKDGKAEEFRYDNLKFYNLDIYKGSQAKDFFVLTVDMTSDGEKIEGPVLFNLYKNKFYVLPKLPKPSGKSYRHSISYANVAISPNGRFIAYDTHVSRSGDITSETRIGLFDTTNNTLNEIASHTAFLKKQPEYNEKYSSVTISKNPYGFSPDSRYLYGSMESMGFFNWSFTKDFSVIYQYDIEKDSYKRLNNGDYNYLTSVSGLSPDGKYLYACGEKASGGYRTCKINIETGKVEEEMDGLMSIMNKYHRQMFAGKYWSRGGNALYYLSGGKEVEEQMKKIPALPAGDLCTHFSQDKKHAFYITEKDDKKYIYRTKDIKPDTEVEELCEIPKDVIAILCMYDYTK